MAAGPEDISLKEVVNTLRSVAQSTDEESAYNADDTIAGNITRKTGTIWKRLTSCLLKILTQAWKANFPNVLLEVTRWVNGLKLTFDDAAFQKYIIGKFCTHIEFGQH